jgi:hypothetical protein
VLQSLHRWSRRSAHRALALCCLLLPLYFLSCGEVYSDLEVPTIVVGTALFNPVKVETNFDGKVDVTIYGLPEGQNAYWKDNSPSIPGVALTWQSDTSCEFLLANIEGPEYDENGNARHCFLLQVPTEEPDEFKIRITFYNGFEEIFADGPLQVVEPPQ